MFTTVERRQQPVRYNLTLKRGQVYRLPTMFSQIRVVAGCAWITHSGKDILLYEGQSASFDHQKGTAIVSAAHTDPVVLELPAQDA